MRGPQDDVLIVSALYCFAQATRNAVIAEHAMVLADEIATQQGLQNAEDALAQSAYLHP